MLAPFKDVTAYGPAELQRFRERFAAFVQHHPRQWQQAQCALLAIRLLWIPAVLAFFLQAGLLAWVLWLAFAGLIAYAIRLLPHMPQCPACDGGLVSLAGRFCPECGGRLLRAPEGPWRRQCAACGTKLSLGRRRRDYFIRACNRCGVVLTDNAM
jgi:hypothetical protein